MESPFGLPTVHWDLEPRQLVGRGVLTAPRLGGLGTARPTLRFMESPHNFDAVHWDHEPRQLVGRGVLTAPPLGGLGPARPTLRLPESPPPARVRPHPGGL